jgi:histidinol-phosphate aminotransferase
MKECAVASEQLFFDRNENAYGPAPACFSALRDVETSRLSMYSRDFERGVSSPLSERLARDFGVAESSILLGYGAEDILKQTVHCFLGAGARILIPSHSWWYYQRLAGEVDGVTVEYPILEHGDTFAYDIDALLRVHDAERPSVVLLSSPNNPTGNALAHDDLLHVLRRMKDTVVVLDQAYWSNAMADDAVIASLHREFPSLMMIRTFSKYYALAGVRIGFAVLGERLGTLSRFGARYLGYHRLSEIVALAALDSPGYYRDIARHMAADREMFARVLGALPGFTVYRSEANFILVKIPEDLYAPLKEELTRRGLIVKFMNEPRLHSHMRITLGTQEQNRQLATSIVGFVGQKAVA